MHCLHFRRWIVCGLAGQPPHALGRQRQLMGVAADQTRRPLRRSPLRSDCRLPRRRPSRRRGRSRRGARRGSGRPSSGTSPTRGTRYSTTFGFDSVVPSYTSSSVVAAPSVIIAAPRSCAVHERGIDGEADIADGRQLLDRDAARLLVDGGNDAAGADLPERRQLVELPCLADRADSDHLTARAEPRADHLAVGELLAVRPGCRRRHPRSHLR